MPDPFPGASTYFKGRAYSYFVKKNDGFRTPSLIGKVLQLTPLLNNNSNVPTEVSYNNINEYSKSTSINMRNIMN